MSLAKQRGKETAVYLCPHCRSENEEMQEDIYIEEVASTENNLLVINKDKIDTIKKSGKFKNDIETYHKNKKTSNNVTPNSGKSIFEKINLSVRTVGIKNTFKRLPYELIPFVLSMFVIV